MANRNKQGGKSEAPGRRYKISEVSEMTGVPITKLRQWGERFSRLRPKRNRVGHRYYDVDDIAIVKRIKYYIEHEGMRTEGVEKALGEEVHGLGRVKTGKEAMALINKIETEVNAMLDAIEKRRRR